MCVCARVCSNHSMKLKNNNITTTSIVSDMHVCECVPLARTLYYLNNHTQLLCTTTLLVSTHTHTHS